MVDYATRYPEVIPLKRTECETVARELITIFSHVGVPKEILSDCGADLTGALMQDLYHLLGVEPIMMSPYHPQTNGMVERFQSTMKGMLQKIISKFDYQWDRALPYVLFTYREVPNETTSFLPI